MITNQHHIYKHTTPSVFCGHQCPGLFLDQTQSISTDNYVLHCFLMLMCLYWCLSCMRGHCSVVSMKSHDQPHQLYCQQFAGLIPSHSVCRITRHRSSTVQWSALFLQQVFVRGGQACLIRVTETSHHGGSEMTKFWLTWYGHGGRFCSWPNQVNEESEFVHVFLSEFL